MMNKTQNIKSRRRRAISFVPALFTIAIAAAGCGPSDAEIDAFVHHYEADVSGAEYIVQPPDMLEITSPTAPELDGETPIVQADGKIKLKLVGDVKVSGLTPAEIARKLETNLQRFYLRPVVNVNVARRESKRI